MIQQGAYYFKEKGKVSYDMAIKPLNFADAASCFDFIT